MKEIIEKREEPRTEHPMVQEERVIDYSQLDVNEALEEEKNKREQERKKTKMSWRKPNLSLNLFFPQRSTTTQKNQQNADWYEVFPLIERIQTPSIVGFLKDLCIVIRKFMSMRSHS